MSVCVAAAGMSRVPLSLRRRRRRHLVIHFHENLAERQLRARAGGRRTTDSSPLLSVFMFLAKPNEPTKGGGGQGRQAGGQASRTARARKALARLNFVA